MAFSMGAQKGLAGHLRVPGAAGDAKGKAWFHRSGGRLQRVELLPGAGAVGEDGAAARADGEEAAVGAEGGRGAHRGGTEGLRNGQRGDMLEAIIVEGGDVDVAVAAGTRQQGRAGVLRAAEDGKIPPELWRVLCRYTTAWRCRAVALRAWKTPTAETVGPGMPPWPQRCRPQHTRGAKKPPKAPKLKNRAPPTAQPAQTASSPEERTGTRSNCHTSHTTTSQATGRRLSRQTSGGGNYLETPPLVSA